MELRDEREVMQAGQAFLDEKRTLIAATLVSMLQRHRQLEARFRTAFVDAKDSLRVALVRHGLEMLQAYPIEPRPDPELVLNPSELLGVALLEARLKLELSEASGELQDGVRSLQAERCRIRFAEILPVVVELAALEVNLRRLHAEYRKTERRASALEDVLIPELEEQFSTLQELLETQEIEEAVRVRVKRKRL